MQEYRESLITNVNSKSAYQSDMNRLTKNEINYSMKNRMMDMRKAVNHPYLVSITNFLLLDLTTLVVD